MGRKKCAKAGNGSDQALLLEANTTGTGARKLTAHELAALRRDMAESSAKMRAEVARRGNKA